MTPANDNRPVFVSRKTAAALMEISPDTFDLWVRAGFVPQPNVSRGQIVRWHWPSVEARLADTSKQQQHDPSVGTGVKHAPKGRRRSAS